MEEATEENIKELLKKIPENLSPLERLILSNEGTVQTFLSVLFKVPIKVVVLSQNDFDGVIIRWSKLVACYAPDNEVTVCLAESVISTDINGFKNGIREKHFGIGQLISALGIITRRRLAGFYSDDTVFSRNYLIEDIGMTPPGNNIRIMITEVFPKEVFRKAEIKL